jgi:hypothetical protein
MAEPLLEIPAGGWTVDDVDAFGKQPQIRTDRWSTDRVTIRLRCRHR